MPGTESSGWHRERPVSGSCFFLFGGSSMVTGSHRHTSKFQTLAQNESIVFVRNTDFGWTRYIFGIPPLILVLLPVASSDCEIEGKSGEEYQHIIMVNFNKLEKIRENASNCPNNEHNFFKKHSCDDDKEAMFLKTAARKLKLFFDMNIHDESKLPLKVISYGTLQLLTCTRKDKEKKQPPPSEAQPTKNLGEKKSLKEQKKLDDICFLVTLLDKIQTCWNKILRGPEEH
ncbi:interleukin-7 isoform X1 [Saccopteryx leptura]|uniref:interleukin-7 isoform X1 n=1 Tax=Saccopteryx leptura TaxID=249018 RepID=UPI00339CDC71